MKKFLNKINILIFTLVVLIPSIATNASTANITTTNIDGFKEAILIDNENNETDNKALIVCSSSPSGYHECYSSGWGHLYKGTNTSTATKIFTYGCAWQCKYCYHVIVTQGELLEGIPIGYYGTYNGATGPINVYGIAVYTNNIMYTDSTSITGYRFRYN